MNSITCSNCGASVPHGIAVCNACGTPTQHNSSGSFCSNCGDVLPSKYAQCSKCGHTKTTFNAPPQVQPQNSGTAPYSYLYKNEGTTIILAVLLGLLTFNGVGHLYLGKMGKGILLLIGSIILFWVGVATVFISVGIPLLIIYFVLFIWQIIDAKNDCRTYNNHVQTTGRAPDNW